MRQLTDNEKDIASKVARKLIKHAATQPWYRKKNEAECSRELTAMVTDAARQYGLPAIWLKSFIMRIQRGDV